MTAADRVLDAGILVILVLPALSYAGVPPLHEAAARTTCLFLGSVLALQALVWRESWLERWREGHRSRRPLAPFPVLLGLLILCGTLSLVPLRPALHQALSPASWWWRTGAGEPGGTVSVSFPLSMNPGATLEAIIGLAAWSSFLLVCAGNGLPWRSLRRAAAILVVTVFAVSVLGAVQWLAGGESLWGAFVRDRATRPFGPFVNRNHFAGWGGMGALVGLGYLLSMTHRRIGSDGPAGHFSMRGGGGRVPTLTPKRFLVGFMTAVVMASVFLSLSRGGMLGLMAGLAFFSLLVASSRRLSGAWGVTGLLLACLAVVGWVGAEPVIERIGTLLNLGDGAQARVDLNRDLLRMAASFPLTGTGPGTFADVLPAFQTANPGASYTHGHNDYLQFLVEWGPLGAALAALSLGVFWWRFLRRWRERRDREVLYLTAGAAGGMVAMLTHAAVDFPFHIPANALTFAFLAGLALKGASTRTVRSSPAERGVGSMC